MEDFTANYCSVCLSSLKPSPLNQSHSYNIECPRCGNFDITETAHVMLSRNGLNNLQIANASGWIRENQGVVISSDKIEDLKKMKTPTVAEKADKLLLYLSKSFLVPGQLYNLAINS